MNQYHPDSNIFYFTAPRLSFLSNLIPHVSLQFIIFTCQTFSLTWNYLFSYFHIPQVACMPKPTYLCIFLGFANVWVILRVNKKIHSKAFSHTKTIVITIWNSLHVCMQRVEKGICNRSER